MTFVFALLAVAAPATNGAVYLDCTTWSASVPGDKEWSFALNEEQGTVDVESPVNNGAANGRKAAIFTAQRVRFMGFVLDRNDLKIERPGEAGTCRLADTAKRAF